jgi:hypothetical protein
MTKTPGNSDTYLGPGIPQLQENGLKELGKKIFFTFIYLRNSHMFINIYPVPNVEKKRNDNAGDTNHCLILF